MSPCGAATTFAMLLRSFGFPATVTVLDGGSAWTLVGVAGELWAHSVLADGEPWLAGGPVPWRQVVALARRGALSELELHSRGVECWVLEGVSLRPGTGEILPGSDLLRHRRRVEQTSTRGLLATAWPPKVGVPLTGHAETDAALSVAVAGLKLSQFGNAPCKLMLFVPVPPLAVKTWFNAWPAPAAPSCP